MSHSVRFDFKRSPVYKKGEGGRNVYSAIASTAALDRDREILIPKGVIIDSFMKNPVMLNIHQHKELPVGRVVNVTVEEDAVKFDFEFADTEDGNKVERMYQTGFMNAFSVGFIPRSYLPTWDLPEEVTTLDVQLPDGSKRTIDLSKYEQRPWGVIPAWELLEISPVPVPSNPEALLQRASEAVVRKFVSEGRSKTLVDMLERDLSGKVNNLADSINAFLKTLDEEVSITNVIPYQKTPVDESAFSDMDQLAAWVRLCSSDGSGEKDTIDWAKFATAYGWFNAEKAESFTSYKYLHHSVVDNALHLSKAGLFVAMAAVIADSGNKDQEGVYKHLEQHYADLGCVAPLLHLDDGKEYTVEQLALIASGKDPFESEGEDQQSESESEESEKDPETSSIDKVVARFDQIDYTLREFEASLKIRMQIVIHMLEEISERTIAAAANGSATSNQSEESNDLGMTENEICAQLSKLQSLFNYVSA